MEILKFIKTLLPTFTKERLSDDARITRDELEGVVLPAFESAGPLTSSKKFASETLQEFNEIYKRNANLGKSANFLGAIAAALPSVIEFQETLQNIIDKKFEKEIIVDGITVYKANVVHAQALVSQVSRFAPMLLNYAYVMETEAVGGDSTYARNSLSRGDIEEIEKGFLDFVTAFAVVSKSGREAMKTFESIPEVTLGSNSDAVSSVYGSKLDPLAMRDVRGFSSSPIFQLRLVVAEWQTNRYKRMQDLKQVLELRLLNLRKQSESSPDPRIEQQIQYTQSRIDRFSEKMRRAEEAVL